MGRRSAEVPLEQVAAVVLGQLARRDIWITDVKIAEFVKRDVTFKETKNGVVIKNRKFSYDQVAGHLVSEEDSPCPPQLGPPPTEPAKPNRNPNLPIRHEMFRPNREDYVQTQRQGMKLTMGRAYPIFSELVKVVQSPYGSLETIYYIVQDDSGQRVEVIGTYFEPMSKGLTFTGVNNHVRPPEGRLSYVDTAPIATGNVGLDTVIAAQDAALTKR